MTESEIAWLREQFDRRRPSLQAALDRDILGTHTIDDVWNAIASDGAQLWPCENAAIVTHIETYPRMKLLRIWLAGGDLRQIIDSGPSILQWARDRGCGAVKVEGARPGWERVFEGPFETQRVIVKRL